MLKNNNFKESDKSKMNFKEEILKSIQTMVNKSIANCKVDITYKSVIKEITPKGYVILDRTGSERTVKCAMPNIELCKGQTVWVKIPMSDIRNMHIVGVA